MERIGDVYVINFLRYDAYISVILRALLLNLGKKNIK